MLLRPAHLTSGKVGTAAPFAPEPPATARMTLTGRAVRGQSRGRIRDDALTRAS